MSVSEFLDREVKVETANTNVVLPYGAIAAVVAIVVFLLIIALA